MDKKYSLIKCKDMVKVDNLMHTLYLSFTSEWSDKYNTVTFTTSKGVVIFSDLSKAETIITFPTEMLDLIRGILK